MLTRSGQGLLGQSEELDELIAKIIGDDIKEGRAVKIQDDMIIGGATQLEAAENYIWILEKLYLTNLKAEPHKTVIFPKSADISGWIWQRGGFISVSPHQRSSLLNTKEEDIKTVRDMRSFIGLYASHDTICNSFRRHDSRTAIRRQIYVEPRSITMVQRSKITHQNQTHVISSTS